jgi:ubiquitin carboxyl-terminal hydrolase 1
VSSDESVSFAAWLSYDQSSLLFTQRAVLAYAAVTGVLVYHMSWYLGYSSFSISELLWNGLVFLTPSQLVLDPERMDAIGSSGRGFSSLRHAAKSEAMRQAFGLEKGSLFANVNPVPKFRRLSIAKIVDGSPPGLGNWDNSCYQNSVIQVSLSECTQEFGADCDASRALHL